MKVEGTERVVVDAREDQRERRQLAMFSLLQVRTDFSSSFSFSRFRLTFKNRFLKIQQPSLQNPKET